MPEPEESNLHELLENPLTTAKDVQDLIVKYDDAVREINEDGRLPLHTALYLGASVEVIRVLLEAYPSAAEKTVKCLKGKGYNYATEDEDILPLHVAIEKKRSLDVVKALLDAYLKGAEATIRGKLPLGLSLTIDGVSDDVVLAVLAAHPDAAKNSLSIGFRKFERSVLPLHAAILTKRSQEVVEALLNAFPGAAENNNLLIHELLDIEDEPNANDLQALIDKYPGARSKKGKYGRLPLHTAVIHKASAEVIRVLLKADPSAAEKTVRWKTKGRDYKNMLPLHIVIMQKCSLDVVQALLEVYPRGAEAKMAGKLPLSYCLRFGAPNDVVLAILAVFPAAAEDTNALLLAIQKKRSLKVVKALLEKYPKGAEARMNVPKARIRGELPLNLALNPLNTTNGRVSDEVVLAILEAYPGAAKEKAVSGLHEGKLPLHVAIEDHRSLDVVKALLDAYPYGVKTRVTDGHLPLCLALECKAFDDVVLAVLAAYPYAAEDAYVIGVDRSELFVLPLHLAIQKKHSLDIIKALLDAYPEGAETRMEGEMHGGKLPLSMALTTNRVSDDVVLAILAVYHEASKENVFYNNYRILPLHFAIEEARSLDIVKALLDAFPGAAKEENPHTKNLPLHDAIDLNTSQEIMVLLIKAYPKAAKKKMKDGRLPFEACAEIEASEDLMLELLKADMPLSLEDGTPVDHGGSWTACVKNETDVAAGAVSRILSPVSEGGGGFGVHIHALADVCDAEGRTALGLASSGPRAAMYEYLLFSRRYKLQTDGAPEHCTPTTVVLRAQDLDEQANYGVIVDKADKDKNGQLDRREVESIAGSIGLDPGLFLKGSDKSTISKEDFVGICKRQLGDGPRNVVIKLMQKKDHWERECNARKEYNLDPKYVVSTLPNIPSEKDIAEAVNRGDGGLETIKKKFLHDIEPGKFAIVMDAADRNLHQIFYQEQPKIDAVRVMLRQVFEAVQHLHEKKPPLMHGDLKMLNIVRFRIDNRLRLIDFDASAKIVPIGGQGESFAGAKFSSAILPPEMIKRIETEQQLQEFNKYWESENDKYLVAKVAPMLYEEQGIVKARYVVKSFRTKEGEPVYEGLPYDLVKASENIDAWALGVLAFTLLTGITLIPSTRDDDCASGAAMHLLYSWGKQPGVLMELFKKIHDNAARDLVQQLLQREPGKRPTVASLLKTHPFFHPERIKQGDEEMKGYVRQMNDRLESVDNTLQSQVKQLEIMNASIAMIKKMSDESKAELFHTRHVLLKAIFDATEVSIPTTFIVLNNMLPPMPSDEQKKKILEIVAAEDGRGVSVQSKYVSVTLSAEGAGINLEGDLKKRYDLGMKWVKCIKSVGAKIVAGEVGKGAFEIINEGIKDLTLGNEMYLYLIDELTGEPVRAKDWPIIITEPSEKVHKLLPLMQVGMRAMSIYNGAAGVARMFGYPVPEVPKAWAEGAQESVELLKQESSVEQFAVVHAEVKGGTEVEKSVRGASLREFVDFMNQHDPGLSKNKSGHFAGLQRIGDPEDGTALWTALTDPKDIENALKERASQREEEQLKHNEHIQKMANAEVKTKEETIINGEPKMTTGLVTVGQIAQPNDARTDARNPSVPSEEIAELMKVAEEATAAAKEAAVAAKEAASVASEEIAELIKVVKEATSSAKDATAAAKHDEPAGKVCCTIM